MVSTCVAVIMSVLVAFVSAEPKPVDGSCNYQTYGELSYYTKTLGPYVVKASKSYVSKYVANSECNNSIFDYGKVVAGVEVTACSYVPGQPPSVTVQNTYDGVQVAVSKAYGPATFKVDVYCQPAFPSSDDAEASKGYIAPNNN